MNFYFVFALALGAITGTAAPSVVVQPVASVIAARSERAAVCGPVSAARVTTDRLKPVLHSSSLPLVAEAPLTGGATPRAPARSC